MYFDINICLDLLTFVNYLLRFAYSCLDLVIVTIRYSCGFFVSIYSEHFFRNKEGEAGMRNPALCLDRTSQIIKQVA